MENKIIIPSPGAIFSIGHSTHPFATFAALLNAHRVTMLVDIRTIPHSQYNPQFNRDALAPALATSGISYRSLQGLGGRRQARLNSPNGGWRNSSFRGYADYMQTATFHENLATLIMLGQKECVAMMCAESNPANCHRSLVADALTAHQISVLHILPTQITQPHQLTGFARMDGKTVLYPSETRELPGLETQDKT